MFRMNTAKLHKTVKNNWIKLHFNTILMKRVVSPFFLSLYSCFLFYFLITLFFSLLCWWRGMLQECSLHTFTSRSLFMSDFLSRLWLFFLSLFFLFLECSYQYRENSIAREYLIQCINSLRDAASLKSGICDVAILLTGSFPSRIGFSYLWKSKILSLSSLVVHNKDSL